VDQRYAGVICQGSGVCMGWSVRYQGYAWGNLSGIRGMHRVVCQGSGVCMGWSVRYQRLFMGWSVRDKWYAWGDLLLESMVRSVRDKEYAWGDLSGIRGMQG
jgi:hypothetical protein